MNRTFATLGAAAALVLAGPATTAGAAAGPASPPPAAQHDQTQHAAAQQGEGRRLAFGPRSARVGPGPAAAGAVAAHCGDVLSTDAYLASDLLCSDGQGLTFLEGVTLDLNGHHLVGPGSTEGIGISFDQSKPMTVRNGWVEGWAVGMAGSDETEPSTTQSTVSAVRFQDNGTAVQAYFDGYVITQAAFARNGVAIAGFSARPVAVTASTFTDGGVEVASTRLTVADSSFVRAPLTCVDGGMDVTRSTFSRAAGYAISQMDCNGSTVTDSTFTRNGTAYESTSNPSAPDQLLRNTFVGNTVAVAPLAGAVIADSWFTRNGTGVRIPADYSGWATYTIERSTFTKNGDAVVVDAVVSIGGVRAVRNTNIGIQAPLAVDLGGNAAWGNGTQPQCQGVSCAALTS